MSGDFPDTEGGNKCGRLSQDEEKLKDDDPLKLNHVLQYAIKYCTVLLVVILLKLTKNQSRLKAIQLLLTLKDQGFCQ